jgi:hypothetical protein
MPSEALTDTEREQAMKDFNARAWARGRQKPA